jgi:hypothetical protein
MTSFVQNTYPSQHPGVTRMMQGVSHLRQMCCRMERQSGGVVLLLAPLVPSLLAVMQQVPNIRSRGQSLGAWLQACAGLALFARPVRRVAQTMRSGYKAWVESRSQDAEEERRRVVALQDARVMADLVRVMEANVPRHQ